VVTIFYERDAKPEALKSKTIATGKGTVKSGKLRLTLKARKNLVKGSYKVTVNAVQPRKKTTLTTTLKVK